VDSHKSLGGKVWDIHLPTQQTDLRNLPAYRPDISTPKVVTKKTIKVVQKAPTMTLGDKFKLFEPRKLTEVKDETSSPSMPPLEESPKPQVRAKAKKPIRQETPTKRVEKFAIADDKHYKNGFVMIYNPLGELIFESPLCKLGIRCTEDCSKDLCAARKSLFINHQLYSNDVIKVSDE